MAEAHNIFDGTHGDVVFMWPPRKMKARHKIPDAKTTFLWLFRWKLTPKRHMRETTPINVDSEEYRPGQEHWMVALSGYIDQQHSPGWFNEAIFKGRGEDRRLLYAEITLRTSASDNEKGRSIKGDFWVEQMDWTVAVDVPNQLDLLLRGTGDLKFTWE